MTSAIRILGLIMALLYLLLGIDDFLWDAINVIRVRRKKRIPQISVEELEQKPCRLRGIMIAAWKEDAVIDQVVDHLIATVQYPRALYYVFIGVYPNDKETRRAVWKLEHKYPNVKMVVNAKPGPTSKADNINNVIKGIKRLERKNGWRFDSLTVHDSEDVVHPYELKMTNYLMDDWDALQFPVFPLQRKPRLGNILRGMTQGTYADEFAENHYRTLVYRDCSAAVVPSAGTGFALSHRILDAYGKKDIFPKNSLTEDYKLSVTLAEQKFRIHYVLEQVPRYSEDGRPKKDYIATRSIFPGTIRTAVRQKTRWIYGITMQSVDFREIFRKNGMGFMQRYSLYKDLKAKIANLMILPGYLVFLYFLVALFYPMPTMYPYGTAVWTLCAVLFVMTVFRQVLRAVAIANVYGLRSMFVGCLLPPLMPVRMVWGNVINMLATFGAWRQLLFGVRIKKKTRTRHIVWSKTDHEFISHEALQHYYRTVEDMIVDRRYMTQKQLFRAMQAVGEKTGIKKYLSLVESGALSQEQLTEVYASTQHQSVVKHLHTYTDPELLKRVDKTWMRENDVYPLLYSRRCWIFAKTWDTPIHAFDDLIKKGERIQTVYTTPAEMQNVRVPGLTARADYIDETKRREILCRLEERTLTLERALLVLETLGDAASVLEELGFEKDGYERNAALPVFKQASVS